MRIWDGGLQVIFVIMIGQLASMVDSKCCEKKVSIKTLLLLCRV